MSEEEIIEVLNEIAARFREQRLYGYVHVVNAVALIVQQQAQIARVRELHGRHDPNCPYGEDCAGAGLCLACREEYPCTTIRALERDNDDE